MQGRYSHGGSRVFLEESLFDKLRRRLESIAEQYREQGQYLKASNVQFEPSAKSIQGRCGTGGAMVCIMKQQCFILKNGKQTKAAQCYEKGKIIKTIELYKVWE